MKTRLAYRSNHAFPAYEHTKRSLVTPSKLSLAIQKATRHFTTHAPEYQRVFRNHACRRLRCKPSAVVFSPLKDSLNRIRNAVLCNCDDCYGWTDGNSIYVTRQFEMGFDELVPRQNAEPAIFVRHDKAHVHLLPQSQA